MTAPRPPSFVPDPPVRRRKVFFVPGFDPLGARRYRELYRTHAGVQARCSGYRIDVQGRPGKGFYGWTAIAEMEGRESSAEIEFLEWADIVKGAMRVSILTSYLQLARTLWLYMASGALWALIRLRYIPMMIALYPAVILILYLVAGVALASVVAALLGPWGWLPGAALGIGFLVLVRRKDGRFYVFYLMSDYAYHAQHGGRMPEALKDRVRGFTARVEAALAADYDEVLIVGHSSGAQIAVHMAARAVVPEGKRLSLLTLGQVIPMVSFLPTAADLRGDLRRASLRDDLFWLDVSAPSDGACFALSDPVDVSGVSPGEAAKRWPIVISAKFSRALSERQHKELRGRFFTKHIQYLRSFEQPGDYDYFRITAGAETLWTRFGWRGSSAAATWDAMSPHRGWD